MAQCSRGFSSWSLGSVAWDLRPHSISSQDCAAEECHLCPNVKEEKGEDEEGLGFQYLLLGCSGSLPSTRFLKGLPASSNATRTKPVTREPLQSPVACDLCLITAFPMAFHELCPVLGHSEFLLSVRMKLILLLAS